MNNTKTLAIVAVFTAAILVVGLTVAAAAAAAAATTPSAFAGGHKERQDKYMKGEQLSYKKGKHVNGKYNGGDNDNTVTIQATTQNGKVSGRDNTLEQEAQNVICTHPTPGSTDNTFGEADRVFRSPVGSCTSEGSEGPAAVMTPRSQ
jgi:hypothetical protein